jgi:hypothetical protein
MGTKEQIKEMTEVRELKIISQRHSKQHLNNLRYFPKGIISY